MRRLFFVLALTLAVGLAAAASPFASQSPDGLQRVASDKGFADRGRSADGPAAGYQAPGVGDARLAKGAAGAAGTLIVFALGYGIASAARRRRPVEA